MGLLRISTLLSLGLLAAMAACSPAPTPAPPTVAPPTESAPTITATPLIAATMEITAEATTPAEATRAVTEAALLSTRETTAEADLTAEATASAPLYLIRQDGPPAACAITPTEGQGVNIRQSPTKDSALLGGLLRGAWVVAQGINQAGSWFQISAPGTPVDGGWITRQNVAIHRGCTCVAGGLCRPADAP